MRVVTLLVLSSLLLLAAPTVAADHEEPHCDNIEGPVRACQYGYYCDFEQGVCGYTRTCVIVGAFDVCWNHG